MVLVQVSRLLEGFSKKSSEVSRGLWHEDYLFGLFVLYDPPIESPHLPHRCLSLPLQAFSTAPELQDRQLECSLVQEAPLGMGTLGSEML